MVPAMNEALPIWACKAAQIPFSNKSFADAEWLVKFAAYVDGPRPGRTKR